MLLERDSTKRSTIYSIGSPDQILFNDRGGGFFNQALNIARGSAVLKQTPVGFVLVVILVIPIMCVQSTDKFPLQTFLQGVGITERTGGEM